jgi:capsid protein
MNGVADMLSGAHLRDPAAVLDAPHAGLHRFAVHDSAAATPTASDWATDYRDPNWTFGAEGHVIGARSEDAARNNPVAAAAIETMCGGVLGEHGLVFRSDFARDLERDSDEAEAATRRAINGSVWRATRNTRFDAAGQRSWRSLLETTLASALLTGDGFAVRVVQPRRYGRQYQSTCVRLIHAGRVSNPHYGPDSDRLFRGIEMDADGNPVAIHVRRYRLVGGLVGADDWQRIPIYGPDGARQVTHLRRSWHPDQMRGVGWLSPILPMLKQFGGVNDAYVVAKRIQACYPLVLLTDDPAALASAARNGTLLTAGMRVKPGTVYVGKTDVQFEYKNLSFNGQDHQQFAESLLQLATAALGLPYEVVINRLNKSNLAAARAALLAAYRAFRIQQHDLIVQVIEPWIEWIIREDIARGRLRPGTDDLDLILRSKFLRPPVPTPNLMQDVSAAKTMIDMGTAPEDAFAMVGMPDFESTIRLHAQNTRLMRAQGVDFNEASVGVDVAQVQQTANAKPTSPDEPDADPTDDPEDDPADGTEVEDQDADADADAGADAAEARP